MAKSKTNPAVDFYFMKGKWQQEFQTLRRIILACPPVSEGEGLVEELKWGCPCYTFGKHNIVLIHGFKEYCALLFFKGVLLKDPAGILIQQTKNVQAGRQLRFTSTREIVSMKALITAYIGEAMEVERAGLKVRKKETKDYKVPEEFQEKLDKSRALKTAFQRLTPGRQRAYLFYFSQAKLSATRAARVEKYVPKILEGKGLDD